MSNGELPVLLGSVANLDASSDGRLVESLTSLAKANDLTWLLSFHDDGVVWGKFDGQAWSFSAGKFEGLPSFRSFTLQECRVFGKTAELLIWREGHVHKASLLSEGSGLAMPYFDRDQLLWGDQVEDRQDGFSLLAEGSQGLRHAVPIERATPRVAISIRNYVAYDDNEQAYVKWSRLLSLQDGIRATGG